MYKYLVPAVFLALTACNSIHTWKSPAGETAQEQKCQSLKRDIIMDSVIAKPLDNGNNPATQARLYRSYDKNNCEAILQQKAGG
jgi:hypothetical protein